MLHEPPMGLPDAPFAHLARGIRAVAGVPVIHGTRMRNAAVGEQVLADGAADMVGMCRALIADPHLPNKSRMGQSHTVNPCVGCQQACFGRVAPGQADQLRRQSTHRAGGGLANPDANAQTPGRVVVVGAGPAGLEAAYGCGRARTSCDGAGSEGQTRRAFGPGGFGAGAGSVAGPDRQ